MERRSLITVLLALVFGFWSTMAVAMLPSQMVLASQEVHATMACCVDHQPQEEAPSCGHSDSSSHPEKHHCEDSCALQCHCVSISVFYENLDSEELMAMSYPNQLNFHYPNALISKGYFYVWLPPKIS